jgi:hypothetical protein
LTQQHHLACEGALLREGESTIPALVGAMVNPAACGAVVWIRRRSLVSTQASNDRHDSHRLAALMGAGIAGLELLSAFPYFSAIAMIVVMGRAERILGPVGLAVRPLASGPRTFHRRVRDRRAGVLDRPGALNLNPLSKSTLAPAGAGPVPSSLRT